MTKLPFQDGEQFIENFDKAIQEGDTNFISENFPKLRQLIQRYQDRAGELTQLKNRAQVTVDHHGKNTDGFSTHIDVVNEDVVTGPFAMIDALGFSNALKTEGLDTVGSKYRNTLLHTYSVASSPFLQSNLRILSGSDTVFLYFLTDNSSVEDRLKVLVHYMAVTIANAIEFQALAYEKEAEGLSSFPLRGSITYGEYSVGDLQLSFSVGDPVNIPIVFGKPVVDAQQWEQQQKWFGASIHPESADRIDFEHPGILDSLAEEKFLVKWDVPTEHGPIAAWAVNFLYHREKQNMAVLMDKTLLQNEQNAEESRAKAKHLAARRFLEHLTEHRIYNPTGDDLDEPQSGAQRDMAETNADQQSDDNINADKRITRLHTPEDCEQFAINVIDGFPELAQAARRRAVELRAELHGAESSVEREALQAVYAYERVISERRGKTVRATRTWQMIKRHGIIEAIERVVKRKDETAGYKALVEMGMSDLAFEAVVCRHPSVFSPEALKHSQERLKEWDK